MLPLAEEEGGGVREGPGAPGSAARLLQDKDGKDGWGTGVRGGGGRMSEWCGGGGV